MIKTLIVNYFLVIALFAFQPLAIGGTPESIKGRVVDNETKAGVSFATVVVAGSAAHGITDEDGNFIIETSPIAKITLEISSVGYQKVSINISETIAGEPVIIYLSPQFINIDEVVVTATRTTRTLQDVPVLTQIINRAQITTHAQTSLAEVISSYASFADFYNEGRGMTFRTQGLSTKYTLFLIDGERVAGENRDNIDYFRLNPSTIDRIEIIPGASSSLYGSSAIGSVINLITSTPRKPLEATFSTGFSNLNQFDHTLSVGGKQGRFRFFVNALRKKADGYDNTPIESPSLYTVEPFQVHSAFSKIYYQASENLDIEGRISFFIRERFNAVSSVPIHPLYTDVAGGARASLAATEKLKLSASIYHDTYSSYDVLERLNNEQRQTYRNSQTTARAVANYQTNWSESIRKTITGGGEYFVDGMFAERIEGQEVENRVASLFVQDEIDIGQNLSLVLGARADLNSEYGNTLSPKISAMYRLGSLNLRSSFARGFRAPSIKERFYDFEITFVTVFGNQNLVPEKSTYVSASAEYLTGSTNLSLNLYRNNVENMIHEVKIQDIFNGYTYENFQNVVVKGLDANIRTRLIGALNLTSSYSYVNALDTETNQQLVGVSMHTGTMVIDYYRHLRKLTTGLTLSAKIYSAKDFINMDYTTGELHPDVYPAFSIWRLSTSLQLFNHSLVIYTGIDNLLNYKATSDLVSNEAPRRVFVKLNIEIDKLFNHFKK